MTAPLVVGPDQAGIATLASAVVAAGLVRGFAGFGSALVMMPLAARVVPPVWALTILVIVDLAGPLPLIPRAFREGEPAVVAAMALAAAIGVPLGVALLSVLPVTAFRWAVSVGALTMLAMLLSGWRYPGRLTRPVSAVAGFLSGFLGGSTGLGGPPVILLNMASRRPARIVRANLVLFLLCTDTIMLATFAVSGRLEPAAVSIGLLLIVPFLFASMLGGTMFHPGRERIYRGLAYALIAGSATAGLPLWR